MGCFLALKYEPLTLQISCEIYRFLLEIGLAFSLYSYKRIASRFSIRVTSKGIVATILPLVPFALDSVVPPLKGQSRFPHSLNLADLDQQNVTEVTPC